VVAILVPVTRDVASRLLDRYVYRTQANYRRTVREASKVLTRVLELRQLLSFISETLRQSTGTEGVAVYLNAEGSFQRAIVDKSDEMAPFLAPEQAPTAVTTVLQATREPVLADEVTLDRSADTDTVLAEAVTHLNWSLILPVESESDIIAIIAVGPKLSGDPFYPQDLDLLMTLANQAGIAIKNARLYAAVVLANEYLQNIVGTIESGVVAVAAPGHVTMFNRAAEQLTGLEAKAYRGRPASLLPACLRDPLSATVADGLPRTIPEAELPAGDGTTTRPIICTTSPLCDPDGHVLGAVVVFSDLTPLKELEIERRRAERLAYFQALASGIAHEIKNPLVAIKTFTQLLPRRRADERFLTEFGRIGNREIGRMHRLLERLRTLSRPSGGPRSVVDLRSPFHEALESLQAAVEQKGHVLTVCLGEAPAPVIGNSTELQQLFMNLLLNAHEATPAGGDITVKLVCTSPVVTVEISDSGPGIQPELLERIFEPFFTTKQRGSGLGLAISAGIAQSHGGRIQADNRSTGGAIFAVTLPRTEHAISVIA
jgi:PAS domain S-box-containing protein